MSTFHLFPHLVPELRQHIWKLSLEPRVISVELGDNLNYDLLTETRQGCSFFRPGVEIVKKETPIDLCKTYGPVLMEIAPNMAVRFTSLEAYQQYEAVKQSCTYPIFASSAAHQQFLALKSTVTYAIFKASLPAGFSVCRESRSCLLPMFTKVLSSHSELSSKSAKLSIPTWVNFAIDTVQCRQYDLPYISRTPWISQIRSMVVDVDDPETMHNNLDSRYRPYLSYIEHDMTSLKHLTIRYMEPRWDEWYDEWHYLLANYYNRCEPLVAFYLRIINPHFPETGELNRTNYLRIWRQERRLERGPSDHTLHDSDSEEDFDVLNHPCGWIHNGKDCLTKCGKVTKW